MCNLRMHHIEVTGTHLTYKTTLTMKMIVMQLVSKIPTFHELLDCYYIQKSLPAAQSHILHSMLCISISCSCITTSTQDKQHKRFPTYIKHSEAADKASLYIIIHICLPQCQGYCIVKLTTGHESHCGHLTEHSLYRAAWKNCRTLVTKTQQNWQK